LEDGLVNTSINNQVTLRMTGIETTSIVSNGSLNNAKDNEWIEVDQMGQALRRSSRKRKGMEKKLEIEKKLKSAKFRVKKITTSDKTTTNTTTTKNNNSMIQTNINTKNKNKKITRINYKEQKLEEEPMHTGVVLSPLVLDLNKSIARAQDSLNKRNNHISETLRNPTLKNEENNKKTVTRDQTELKMFINSESGSWDSDASGVSIGSKKSYVSIASSKSKNGEKADIFNKEHEDKIEAEHCKQIRQQQQNAVKNSIIRQF
jgi:hypothetical protein